MNKQNKHVPFDGKDEEGNYYFKFTVPFGTSIHNSINKNTNDYQDTRCNLRLQTSTEADQTR